MANKKKIPQELEEIFGYLLSRATSLIREMTSDELAPFSLTPSNYRVLLILSQHESLSQQEICELVKVDKNTMVQIILNLVKKKWISKKRDSSDKRAFRISITSEGKEVLSDSTPAVKNAQLKFVKDLSQNELRNLKSYLLKLIMANSK